MARLSLRRAAVKITVMFKSRFSVEGRALGLISAAVLTLSFCLMSVRVCSADTGGSSVDLAGYMTRMVLALLFLAGAGYAAVKYLPGRFKFGSQGKLRMIGALPLGRDVVYLIQTGPDVVALFVGKSGSTVIGRWSSDEWDDYEALQSGGFAKSDER